MADSVSLINAPVLVLNQNYQPLNICNARRAFVLMGHGKAETVLSGRGNVRSATQTFPSHRLSACTIWSSGRSFAGGFRARAYSTGTASRANTAVTLPGS